MPVACAMAGVALSIYLPAYLPAYLRLPAHVGTPTLSSLRLSSLLRVFMAWCQIGRLGYAALRPRSGAGCSTAGARKRVPKMALFGMAPPGARAPNTGPATTAATVLVAWVDPWSDSPSVRRTVAAWHGAVTLTQAPRSSHFGFLFC